VLVICGPTRYRAPHQIGQDTLIINHKRPTCALQFKDRASNALPSLPSRNIKWESLVKAALLTYLIYPLTSCHRNLESTIKGVPKDIIICLATMVAKSKVLSQSYCLTDYSSPLVINDQQPQDIKKQR